MLPNLFFFEEVSTFSRGLVLGVVVAAPVGPVGLLCIRRTLQRGIAHGLLTGIGAALADGIFGAIAAFGVTAALQWVANVETEVRIFGGLFLLAMAMYTMVQKVHIDRTNKGTSTRKLLSAMASGLFITLTNPMTLIGVLAVVAAFTGQLTFVQAATLTGGVFCGSAAWWLFLCGGTHLIRDKVNDTAITWVNRSTAVFILILGAWALYTGVGAALGYPVWKMHIG
jgi:threonine/homoserine/homoserine lactone efflux protein